MSRVVVTNRHDAADAEPQRPDVLVIAWEWARRKLPTLPDASLARQAGPPRRPGGAKEESYGQISASPAGAQGQTAVTPNAEPLSLDLLSLAGGILRVHVT